jgi:protein ImuB
VARIVCLWIRDLPLIALLRIEPDLERGCVAVVDGRSPQARVLTLTSAAVAAGLIVGMTAAQARAVQADVSLRPVSTTARQAAVEALADVAGTVTPRFEVGDDGAVFLDVEGCAALHRTEAALAATLSARAERQGLPIAVGIGDSKFVARLAARDAEGVRIVPSVATRAFLADRPLDLLDLDPALARTLAEWGLRTIGELAALPAGAVLHRLGPSAAPWLRHARGEDDAPVRCRKTPPAFREAMMLETGIERLDALLFVVRRLLDRMCDRLVLQGLACERLELRLGLEGGGCDARYLTIAAPTAESRTLATFVRTHVEHRPPGAAVIDVALAGTPARVRSTQLDLFRPAGPSAAALAATLARLAARCGDDRIGSPRPADSHRPGGAVTVPFRVDERPPGPHATAGARVALRAFRPPVALDVFVQQHGLEYVRARGFGGRVVHCAGPWRLRGEWWSDDPFAREYYDVELSDGGVYRIYHDLRARTWRADGMYD